MIIMWGTASETVEKAPFIWASQTLEPDSNTPFIYTKGISAGKYIMIKVEIDSIRVSLMSQDRVVVLKDSSGDHYLPIWIGPFEAEAIRVELQGVPVQRPLTHDLLRSAIEELGGQVERIVINELKNDIFYAQIHVNTEGRKVEIDSRPSDAIALAVRVKADIYVDDSVMLKASIAPEEEVTATSGEVRKTSAGGDGDTLEEDLGVFRDFLDTLDMEDFDDN
jgi:hypothetical protein